jgi:hypothetical protein|tara:strand:- start:28 stop:234 length:207 start_codon:yes stop_codon:yes gene_type:complete
MREYYEKTKSYPSPSKRANKAEPSTPSFADSTKTQSIKEGVCLDKPEKAKVKAAYGQTKGLLWYRSIK